MMIPGKKYKHKNCLDMVIEICRALTYSGYIIRYWHKNGWLLHDKYEIVNIQDESNWKQVDIS